MGLLIRVYDIVSPNDFDLSIGLSPYGPFTPLGSYQSSNVRDYNLNPLYIGDNQPLISGGTPPSTDIIYHNIEFDTQYWLKIEDSVNVIDECTGNNIPRYIVENIFIHDSKSFECYDRISFEVVYDPDTCPTPTPRPTSTPQPTPQPTPSTDCNIDATFVEYIVDVVGDPAPCNEGMDVVFLIDYTGSMGSGINNVKTQVTNIVNTIITESNNNYRLGLVIFDEYSSGTVSNYSNRTAYTSLPSDQKYVNTGIGSKFQWITAMEKMSTNNQLSFTNQLNIFNTTNFPLGSGIGYPEPSDMGIDLVGTEDFAGTFRSGVSKLIILITDATPSGNDDNYNSTDITFINGLITPLYNENKRVLLMTTAPLNALYGLATGTNGLVTNGFSSTNIINAIEDICD